MAGKTELICETVLCSIDLETTGTSPIDDSIIEIGCVKKYRDGTITTFHSFCNPEGGISHQSYRVHGIKEEDVSSAPRISEILPELIEFIRGSLLVIQDPGFDLSFLEKSFIDNGHDTSILKAFDTVRLAKKCFPDLPRHKLSILCREFDIPLVAHRALEDARGCLEVFNIIMEQIDPLQKWTVGDLISYHGDMIRSRIIMNVKNGGRLYRSLVRGKPSNIRYREENGFVKKYEIVPIYFVKYGKNKYISASCSEYNNIVYLRIDDILQIG